jgi:hypothetical protein
MKPKVGDIEEGRYGIQHRVVKVTKHKHYSTVTEPADERSQKIQELAHNRDIELYLAMYNAVGEVVEGWGISWEELLQTFRYGIEFVGAFEDAVAEVWDCVVEAAPQIVDPDQVAAAA